MKALLSCADLTYMSSAQQTPDKQQSGNEHIPLRLTLSTTAVALLCLAVSCSPACGKDIYISQTIAGAANGSSCANAYPATYFNTSGNWGPGASQIGPGTTVHLCGTISTPISAQASGTMGSPITI